MFHFGWLWSRRKADIEFTTPLRTDECQQRLIEALSHRPKLLSLKPERPAFGKVQDTRFYMCRAYGVCRNDFSPILYGKLTPTPRGTLVQASFRNPVAIAFLAAVVMFGLCGVISRLLSSDVTWWGDLLFLSIYWGLMAAFVGLASWSAKSSCNIIAEYLRKTLSAC